MQRNANLCIQRQIRVRVLLDSVEQLSSSGVNCICVCIVVLLVSAQEPRAHLVTVVLIRSNRATPCHVAVLVISGSGHAFFFQFSHLLFFFLSFSKDNPVEIFS